MSFCHQKNPFLALVMFNSMQCDKGKSVIIFASWKFSEMGAETTNRGTDAIKV